MMMPKFETQYAVLQLLRLVLINIRRYGTRIVIGGDFNSNVRSPQWSDELDVAEQWGSGLPGAQRAT